VYNIIIMMMMMMMLLDEAVWDLYRPQNPPTTATPLRELDLCDKKWTV